MTNKIVSVLLCALLSSTIAHEYREKKLVHDEHHQRSLNHHSHQEKSLLHHHQRSLHHHLNALSRANSNNETCTWVCTGEGGGNTTGGLDIIVNATLNIIGVVNITANVAIIIDVNANLVAVFNGNTGVAIIIDLKAETGIYIAAGVSTKVWIAASASFEVFFQSISSLQVFIDLHVGVSFTFTSITEVVLKEIAVILVGLSAGIAAHIKQDIKLALTILVEISSGFVAVLGGALKGILAFVAAATLLHIAGDIIFLLYVFKGIAWVINAIPGGLKAIIEAGIVLKLALILAAANGLEALINLLLQIAGKIDLTSFFKALLSSPVQFVELIVLLGGGVAVGASGVFTVIYSILLFINAKVQYGAVINAILQFAAVAHGGIDIAVTITGLLEVVKIQNGTFNNGAELEEVIQIVVSIKENKWIVSGVNISDIIGALIFSTSTAITVVFAVISKLSAVIKPAEAISGVIVQLLSLLTSSAGIVLLIAAFAELKAIESQLLSGNIAGAIAANFSLTGFIKGGLSLTNLLGAIPIIGPIYVAVAKSVTVVFGGQISLGAVLAGSGAAVIQIKAFIAFVFNIQGGLVARLLGATAAQWKGGVAVSVGISVSGGAVIGGGGGGSSNVTSSAAVTEVTQKFSVGARKEHLHLKSAEHHQHQQEKHHHAHY